MTGRELWPQAGDVWVKPNMDRLEWRRNVKPGDPITFQTVLINGVMPKKGDPVDVRFFKNNTLEPFHNVVIYLAPGEGVEVYRNDVRIHPKDDSPS